MTVKDTRLWQYRPGEARIFASREAIPAGEGWQDLPVKEGGNHGELQPERIEAGEGTGPSNAEASESGKSGETGEAQTGEVLTGKPAPAGKPTLTLPKGVTRK